MDIRKISLYLSGKLPPHYIFSNQGRFRRVVKKYFPEFIEDTQLNFIEKQSQQSEDLFFMVLDDIYKDFWESKEFIELLWDLEIPDELYKKIRIFWKYTWDNFTNLLKSRYWHTPNTNQKWELFEELCFDILRIVWWFKNVKKASAWWDWWIDVTAEYRLPIWTNTDIKLWFFWQAKYKSNWNVQESEINRLTTTISNDTDQKYQGIFYFTNKEFAPKAREALENISHWISNRKCFWLDWNEILDIISENDELFKKYSLIS